jgi:serpin B
MVEDDSSGLPIVVDNVIHKVVIEVNEEGTKATAITMVISAEECEIQRWSPPPQVDFVADHPFAFYIVEEVTGMIVFARHVLDPSKQ